MKKNKITRAASFTVAAAFTFAVGGELAGRAFNSGKFESVPLAISGVSRNQTVYEHKDAEVKVLSEEEALPVSERLSNAVSSNDSETVASICDELIAGLESDRAQLAEVSEDLSEWADAEIVDREEKFINSSEIKYARTIEALTELKNGSSPDKNLAFIIDNLKGPEEFYRSDAAPTTISSGKAISTESGAKSTKSTISASPAATADDLDYKKENPSYEAIKKVADGFSDVSSVYLYVKNAIKNEAYIGSKKGAEITLEQCGGNDIDQASLLVALLRAKGIPARYVSGRVEITAEQAMELTGAEDAATAGRILSESYKEVSSVSQGGKTARYRFSHTWVEAYVPYTDYRGAGNKTGDKVWLQLDPSFKKLITNSEEIQPEFSDSDKALMAMVNENAEKYPGLITPASEDKVICKFRTIDPENGTYLPSSLPYTVIEVSERNSFVKDADKDSIAITIEGEKLLDAPVAELYGKPLTITYAPATDSDKKVIEKYGDITKAPAYLVNVVPVVQSGDIKKTGSKPVSLGAVQKMTTAIKEGENSVMLEDTLLGGSAYAINLDLQKISEVDAKKAEERMNAIKDSDNFTGMLEADIMGTFLDYAGKFYFSLCDCNDAGSALSGNVIADRKLALAITGYRFESEVSCGVVQKLNPGSFYIDVAYNDYSVISPVGDREAEKTYAMGAGETSSYYEGYIWEQLVNKGKTGISTSAVIAAAAKEGVDPVYIVPANIEEKLAECSVSENVKEEIRNFVNRGMGVELVPQTLQIGDWKGTAYTAFDMKTGAGSYMISGGTAGGSSADKFEFLFQVNMFLFSLNTDLSLISISKSYATLLQGEVLNNGEDIFKGAVGVISGGLALGSAFKMRYDTINFIFDYAERGDACLDDFVGFTLRNIFDTLRTIAGLCGEFISEVAQNVIDFANTIIDAFEAVYDGTERYEEDGSIANADNVMSAINIIVDLLGLLG